MEKNKFQNLTGNDLDKLMNLAFLNLDLEQPLNQKLLESISARALPKTNLFPSFNKVIFNKLILVISTCVLADGLSLYLKRMEASEIKPATISETLQTSVDQKNLNGERLTTQPKASPTRKNEIKKTVSNIVSVETQEKIMLSGIIHSAKTTEPLKGAAVYKLNSGISVASTDQGYYALQLPRGENVIGVSLLGYQTFTFSVYSNEDVKKDIEMKEVWKALDEVVVKPGDYIFPVLTEKEKKANEKEKQKMAKLAARAKQVREKHGDKYPFIPAPADKAFPGFNMGSNEITNLEYRTFLFDLLINEKKEEFLVAKPEQDQWINAGGLHLFDTLNRIYFAEKKYNSYPVVNISVTGAQMYCNWLSDQANIIRRKEGKAEILIRLPYEKEWLHAASGGHPGAAYPWPKDSVQNHVNWFLANLCIQKQADKFRYPLGHTRKSDLNAHTSAGMVLGNNRIATIETFAYNPNDFYLYCTSGNVSEMVYLTGTRNVKTKGGNWNSDFEHLKLNSEDEFKTVKPSPMIGFRVCIDVKK